MNTDIEDIRLLSLEVAEEFHGRLSNIVENHAMSHLNGPHIISLVYTHVFELLHADQDVSVSTRVAFLKNLVSKMTKNLFDVEFYGPTRLPEDKRTEEVVRQLWVHLDKAYTNMISVGLPMLSITVESPAQRIKDARVKSTDEHTANTQTAP